MNLFGMLELSGSALGAERQRAEVVASNMANAQTTRTPAGGPYRRQLVIFQSQRIPRFSLALAGLQRENSSAVRVAAVVSDQRPPVLRFEPGTDGGADLTARWTVRDATGARPQAARESHVTEPASGGDTAAAVAAMSRALGMLSSEIAAGVRDRDPPSGSR